MIELTKQEHEALVRIVKEKLEEMGMSASDLAEVTGYKPSSIYRLMNTGVKCSGYCAYMVMRELGIRKEDLT